MFLQFLPLDHAQQIKCTGVSTDRSRRFRGTLFEVRAGPVTGKTFTAREHLQLHINNVDIFLDMTHLIGKNVAVVVSNKRAKYHGCCR